MTEQKLFGDQKQQTYRHSHLCGNCLKENELQIPKGTSVMKFLQAAKCFFCGCNLGKISEIMWK